MRRYNDPPEEVYKPIEVRMYEEGYEVWEIAAKFYREESDIVKRLVKYYDTTSKKLIFKIGEQNVRTLLKIMNIKTPNNE